MSRYTFTTAEHTVVVGWDRPLHTYFAQVWKGEPESEENIVKGQESLGPVPLLWTGTRLKQVPTVQDLADSLKPYGEIPSSIQESLERDNPQVNDHEEVQEEDLEITR